MRTLINSVYLICLLVCLRSFTADAQMSLDRSLNLDDFSAAIVDKFNHPKLVEKFYQLKEEKLFWFADNTEAPTLRSTLFSLLESSTYLGLNKADYHYDFIAKNKDIISSITDSLISNKADWLFTDAMISLCKDIYEGKDMDKWLSYNEVSAKFQHGCDNFLITGLSYISTAGELEWFLSFLEPISKEYRLLKDTLKAKIDSGFIDKQKELSTTLNFIRFVDHFPLEKYIVINAATATLKYYVQDTVQLQMKVVVGQTSTPTPRFAAHCNAVVLYPYWNVPASITLNELLPKIKKNPGYLNSMNMQVLDKKGRVIDPATLDWSSFSSKYLPYTLRQSTGCDNALGVIKFNLTDPFSVYMHDTNNKLAFLAGSRYFSHGCIRLEKPVELAQSMLSMEIDTELLESCKKNQQSIIRKLDSPIPVFVVYMPAEADATGKIKYAKDVYKLL